MRNETLPRPLECIIIDDEDSAIHELRTRLSEFPSLKVISSITDAENAVSEIVSSRPDIVFLDIQMPNKSGFEIVEELHQTTVNPFIIFVTAYDTFAIRAIRASVFDFLLKPVNPAELTLSIDRAIKKVSQQTESVSYSSLLDQIRVRKIKFSSTGGFVLVNPDDILFVQADWNYSEIHYSRDKHDMVTLNLGAVEEMLPSDRFVRVNRGTLINIKYLERVNRKKRVCILKKDTEIYEFKIPLLRIRHLEERL